MPPPLPQRTNSSAARPPKVPRDKTVPVPIPQNPWERSFRRFDSFNLYVNGLGMLALWRHTKSIWRDYWTSLKTVAVASSILTCKLIINLFVTVCKNFTTITQIVIVVCDLDTELFQVIFWWRTAVIHQFQLGILSFLHGLVCTLFTFDIHFQLSLPKWGFKNEKTK